MKTTRTRKSMQVATSLSAGNCGKWCGKCLASNGRLVNACNNCRKKCG